MNKDQLLVETASWMKEMEVINPAKPKTVYHYIGRMVNMPGMSAVSESGTGATRLYCNEHHAIFPIHGTCPVCAETVVAEVPIENPVKAG